MNGDLELIRIIDRARIELVYTRASLHQFMRDVEPLNTDIGVLISKCNDTIREADLLITQVRERTQPRPKLVET